MTEPTIPWPDWQIDNALAILRNAKKGINDCHDPDRTDVVNGMNHALDLGISVIEGIKEKTPPMPEPPEVVAHKAVRKFRRTLAEAFREMAYALEEDEWKFGDEE